MSRLPVLVAALAWIVLATDACADTVYLTNGQSLWGREVYEEGNVVVIVRPGGDVRIPKSQVNRIERVRSTLPPYFTPPEQPSSTGEASSRTVPLGAAGGRPTAPGTPAPGSPGAPGGELSPPPAPGAVPPRSTSEGTRTQLPPPPPPPIPGR